MKPVPTEASRDSGEEVEICVDPKGSMALDIVWESEVFSFKHNAESVHTVENADTLCHHFDLYDNLLTATTPSESAFRHEHSVLGFFSNLLENRSHVRRETKNMDVKFC